ncbi:MAG: SMP-30/gluconolactonase/LRE family protein, partial [Sulfitobacter sp.]|nr:SMP-30/gluconolactonase/LRE family protein [Sulfitobacter sp.]
GDDLREWQFDEHHSAAGWVDEQSLLIASETGLWRFDTHSGARERICALEADNPTTRSNDGRADPWGGFWIGSMGKGEEPKAGSIHRYYRGEVRRLFEGITVSNAICFAPDRTCAYFSDTHSGQIMRQPLEENTGWPKGTPEVHIDLRGDRLNPDGAVTDAAGNIWVACWGAARVACYGPDGSPVRQIEVPARLVTCPAFGGPDLRDLYATSATIGLDAAAMEKRPLNGQTFVQKDVAQGLPEPQVIL